MIRRRCEKCGESYPAAEEHECPPEPPEPPPGSHYDEKQWRKDYMRKYMRDKRERLRRQKAEPPKDMAS